MVNYNEMEEGDEDELDSLEETRRSLLNQGVKTLSQIFRIPSKSINSLPGENTRKKVKKLGDLTNGSRLVCFVVNLLTSICAILRFVYQISEIALKPFMMV